MSTRLSRMPVAIRRKASLDARTVGGTGGGTARRVQEAMQRHAGGGAGGHMGGGVSTVELRAAPVLNDAVNMGILSSGSASIIGGYKPIYVKRASGELGYDISPLLGGGRAPHRSPAAISRNFG
eukprot:scaffold3440_cov135-Isochrysis_galbana.AAC.8